MNSFHVTDDIEIIKELLDISYAEFAESIGVSAETVSRWLSSEQNISDDNIKAIYDFAFDEKIRLNKIKEQLFKEECKDANHIVLFHGSKSSIDGDLSLERSRGTNDFGNGFYCGENMEQSAMFVSGYPNSSLYIVEFDKSDITGTRFFADIDWMLAIAYFRGRLGDYAGHPKIKSILNKIAEADYIIAPVADNRMFEIIDSFIDGEITDIQCQHCLSATDLGNQYVMKTRKALDKVTVKRRCYLCKNEKSYYMTSKQEESKTGNDKVKVARRQYRGQGQYIEDILK